MVRRCRIAGFSDRYLALGRDVAGSMLPMVAAGLVVVMALIGGGVDMSRVYKVQNRLQSACDAGVLAGRKAVTTNGFDSAAQTQASNYFAANFDADQQGVTSASFSPTTSDSGATITATASAAVPMVVMELFGKTSMGVTANCSATEGIRNLDVTFVLDTTGSMGTILTGSMTRLDALKAAAKNFYTTVSTSAAGTTARIRYAFVPFSSGVNAGALLYSLNPNNLIDTYTVQSRVARTKTTVNGSFLNNASYSYPQSQEQYAGSGYNTTPAQYGSSSYASLPACQAATPADGNWTNNGAGSSATTNNFSINGGAQHVTRTTVTQPQTRTYYFCNRSGEVYYIYGYTASRSYLTYTYGALVPTSTSSSTAFDHWDYRPVTYDMSQYKTGAAVTTYTGTSGGAVSSTWGGCIEERYTRSDATFSYDSSSARITPTTAIDLDIDSAPTSDDATKWAPQWPELAFYRTNSSGSTMSSALLTQVGSQAAAYCPTASTTLAAMTQTAFNTYVDGLIANGDTYHDFGMLWGARISSPDGMWSSIVNQAPSNHQSVSRHLILETDGQPNAAYNIQQMYGIEYHDRRITDDGSTDDDVRHVQRFRALCDAIKAKGIRIWVIATATALTTDLTYCASDSSSYTAASSSQLNSAFQSIAKQIGELRITQ